MNKKTLIFFLLFIFCLQFIVYSDYTIQLGSFKTESRAKVAKGNFSKQLQKEFLFITKSDLGEKGIWFRIKYGRFAKKANANKILSDLKEKKIPAFLSVFPKNKVMDYFYSNNEIVKKTKTPPINTTTKIDTTTINNNIVNKEGHVNTEGIPLKINDINMKNKQFLFKLDIVNNLLVKELQSEKQNNMDRVIKKYKKLLVDYYDVPDLFKTYYMLSRCYLYQNHVSKALTSINKAISFAPKKEKPSMIYEKGFLQYIFLRNYDEALDTFKELSLKYPSSSWALLAQQSINEILKFKIYKVN